MSTSGLQGERYADLVAATQRELGRNRWEDLTHDLTEFVVMPKLLKKERVSLEENSWGSQWNLVTDHGSAAAHTGLYAVTDADVKDHIRQANIPFRHSHTKWAWDEREVKMNSGAARIVDMVKVKRFAAMSSLAELLEETFWSKPVDSSDDMTPFGIFYYLVPDTTSTGGFNGGNPSGFSGGAASIDSTVLTRWKNWNAGYLNISKLDLVRKMREAATKTGFKSPIKHPAYDDGRDRYAYFSNYAVIQQFEELLETQNDSLGNDIASKDGDVMFRRHTIQYAPQLDGNAYVTNPVIGLCWSVMELVFLKGEYLNEGRPIRAANQNRVWNVFVDLTWNLRVRNRRRNWLISYGS